MTMMKIGIVGAGFVGKATSLFECDNPPIIDVKVITYDKDDSKCSPVGTSIKDLSDCDLVFICVPTPMNSDGRCHTEIVENCIYDLKTAGVSNENIIVRSTVPVGFCSSMSVNFMPEFLTESNWKLDFKNNNAWVLGLHDADNKLVKNKFTDLITLAKKHGKIKHDDKYFCSNNEAELVKLARNSFLACKVSFFNEIKEFADKKDCDYNTVSSLVGIDKRIGSSHTQVPGPDGKKGFGGTCFPKDISSLELQMSDTQMESYILEAVKARNLQIDRPEEDWKHNLGRSVI